MNRPLFRGTVALIAAAVAAGAAVPLGGAPRQTLQAAEAVQSVSWDRWLAAKAKAEECDAAGNLVAALQYYLEYTRQAEGLGSPLRVAWGKNNAAYMIIKMHRLDATVDLAPARKLLEEGLAIEGASEDCKRALASNLEHVKSILRSPL
ncbi:MAG TPA: hypothetical protein PLP83_09365 [Candidatus Aminicenantes bacterium]|nr:hypothetical protein [Candidatus Aminicenantes bacterium]